MEKKKRAFLGWLSKSQKSDEMLVHSALETLVATMKSAGFEWVETDFTGAKAQTNTVTFERERTHGQIDSVVFLFSRKGSLKFTIFMMARRKESPHEWIRGGDLVGNKRSRGKEYWWGERGLQFTKKARFESAVSKAQNALPQVFEYLDYGVVGPQIWDRKIHPSKRYPPQKQ